ncbi:hypothetical protein [Acinetobacter baumannii]|nr:hypothetical protein [Acinetobacter baumannii]
MEDSTQSFGHPAAIHCSLVGISMDFLPSDSSFLLNRTGFVGESIF